MLSGSLRLSDGLLTTILVRSCKVGKYSQATELWFRLLKKGFTPNMVTPNALIHELSMASFMHKAARLLKEMVNRGLELDRVTFNTIISGCCREAKLEEGFKLRKQMEDWDIGSDIITHIMLSHCMCNADRIDEAIKLWMSARNVDWFQCLYIVMINGYGNDEMIDDAESLFNELVLQNSECMLFIIQ